MTLDTQQSFLLQARLCKNSRYIRLYNPVRKSVKIISFFSAVIIPATDIAIDVQVIAISTKNVWITTPIITGNLGLHPSTPSQAVNPNKDSVVSRGQQHSINFTGHTISIDGICGKNTLANVQRCFQHAINLDYKKKLSEDGIFGTKSKEALGKHYVKKGEKQYLVTAVEIALMCRGYDVNGVECPGIFGDGLEKAVKQFQSDRGLTVDGIAGRNTILKLIRC